MKDKDFAPSRVGDGPGMPRDNCPQCERLKAEREKVKGELREAEAREGELQQYLDYECGTCRANSEDDCIAFSCVLKGVRKALSCPLSPNPEILINGGMKDVGP